MFRVIHCLALSLSMLCISAQSQATLQSDFYDGTEIDQYIEDFATLTEFGFDKQAHNLNSETKLSASQMSRLNHILQPPNLNLYKDMAEAKILAMFTEAELQQLVDWKQSGFGRRLQRLMRFSHTPEGMDQMKSYFDKQQSTKESRMTQITALAKNLRDIELLINVAVQTQTTIRIALHTANQKTPKDYVSEFNETKQMALAGQDNAKKFVYADLLYTYRTLQERDLQKYLEFTESPLGKKYYLSRQKVITSVIAKMSQDMAGEILKLSAKPTAQNSHLGNPQLDYQADFQKALSLYKQRNFTAAYPIFERIGQKGHIEAQYYLGLMYNNGEFVSLNEMTAYAWANLAGSQGHKEARDIANRIFGNFSMVNISKAGRLARQYSEEYHADAEKRRQQQAAQAEEKAEFEAELADNQARIEKERALNAASSEEKQNRHRLAKRSLQQRELMLERYPLPELMGTAPTIITEP